MSVNDPHSSGAVCCAGCVPSAHHGLVVPGHDRPESLSNYACQCHDHQAPTPVVRDIAAWQCYYAATTDTGGGLKTCMHQRSYDATELHHGDVISRLFVNKDASKYVVSMHPILVHCTSRPTTRNEHAQRACTDERQCTHEHEWAYCYHARPHPYERARSHRPPHAIRRCVVRST